MTKITPTALRDLANRWAEEFSAAGMPHPMPLSMYPDAWLRAQADRIEQEARDEQAAALEERERDLRELCAKHEVDPARVLRDSVGIDRRYRYVWRTAASWPAGGTYEADTPRNPDDTCVGVREMYTLRLTVMGHDARGRSMPAHWDREVTDLVFASEKPVRFYQDA